MGNESGERYFNKNCNYGLMFITWRGLEFLVCKNEEEMNRAYEEYKGFYRYVKKIKIEDIENVNKSPDMLNGYKKIVKELQKEGDTIIPSFEQYKQDIEKYKSVKICKE